MLKNISSRLLGLFFIAALAFQATWYAILLTYMLGGYKGLKGGADYLAHYSAGYILRYISPERLYDLDLQRHIQVSVASSDQLDLDTYFNTNMGLLENHLYFSSYSLPYQFIEGTGKTESACQP